MAASPTIPAVEQVPTADQRIVTHGVSWSDFEAQLALRGDVSVPRMSYLEGMLEQMRPSKDHERIKSYIGRLIEAYALARGVDLSPYGAWTLKNAPKESAVEPDECYIVGRNQEKDAPDLVIEVQWTRGGIDKLEVYRRLGIAEVWLWKGAQVEVHVLRGERYERSARSRVLPDLDVELLVSFLDRPTALQAVRAFQDALRKPAGGGTRRRRGSRQRRA